MLVKVLGENLKYFLWEKLKLCERRCFNESVYRWICENDEVPKNPYIDESNPFDNLIEPRLIRNFRNIERVLLSVRRIWENLLEWNVKALVVKKRGNLRFMKIHFCSYFQKIFVVIARVGLCHTRAHDSPSVNSCLCRKQGSNIKTWSKDFFVFCCIEQEAKIRCSSDSDGDIISYFDESKNRLDWMEIQSLSFGLPVKSVTAENTINKN